MEFFALVYESDIRHNGQCAIFFNRKAHHLVDNTISVKQCNHQHDTEMALVKEVRKTFPNAEVFTDTAHPGEFRCIKK